MTLKLLLCFLALNEFRASTYLPNSNNKDTRSKCKYAQRNSYMLDKFTRVTLHAFVQSTSSSTESPSEEILHSADFYVHCPKIGKNHVRGKFPQQETGQKSPYSTKCGNFLFILHEIQGNQSSRMSLGSCQLSFEMFPILRFVTTKQIFVFMAVLSN